MTLRNAIRSQEEVPTSQSGLADHKYVLNWPKTRPAKMTTKTAGSAQLGDPIAVTSVTNNFIFIK